jgi:hypothetical protein
MIWAPQRGLNMKETPHPLSYLRHPLPKESVSELRRS